MDTFSHCYENHFFTSNHRVALIQRKILHRSIYTVVLKIFLNSLRTFYTSFSSNSPIDSFQIYPQLSSIQFLVLTFLKLTSHLLQFVLYIYIRVWHYPLNCGQPFRNPENIPMFLLWNCLETRNISKSYSNDIFYKLKCDFESNQ